MNPQHLSDEAVAAFADGALTGLARQRARQHTADCPECAYAVAVQREAAWALRTAPAPALPSGLLDRLREVPATTPIQTPPTVLGSDGSTMLATFGNLAVPAAIVPVEQERPHRMRPIVGAAVAVAAAGVLAVSSAAHASSGNASPSTPRPAHPVQVQPAGYSPAHHAVLGR
ncbi:MAG TPA: zf-HC2 domain-containing protein [Jatrophihabitantaceae bacterium]|nr:zf-HC2 domain-containing protein [Jatrophihabitantaceae bacterium]